MRGRARGGAPPVVPPAARPSDLVPAIEQAEDWFDRLQRWAARTEQGVIVRVLRQAAVVLAIGFAYVVVSAPQRPALDEALVFLGRLRSLGLRGDAMVLNRVHHRASMPIARDDVASALGRFGLDPGLADGVVEAVGDEDAQAALDAVELARLDERLPSVCATPPMRIELPLLAVDVHDLGELLPLSARLV